MDNELHKYNHLSSFCTHICAYYIVLHCKSDKACSAQTYFGDTESWARKRVFAARDTCGALSTGYGTESQLCYEWREHR